MKEVTIEQYLVKRVKQLGGEVRKVKWLDRSKAPDRLVCIPGEFFGRTGIYTLPIIALVELKNPDTIATFPANAHERAQAREHDRLRAAGMRVEVIGTKEQVDSFLGV